MQCWKTFNVSALQKLHTYEDCLKKSRAWHTWPIIRKHCKVLSLTSLYLKFYGISLVFILLTAIKQDYFRGFRKMKDLEKQAIIKYFHLKSWMSKQTKEEMNSTLNDSMTSYSMVKSKLLSLKWDERARVMSSL